MERILEIHTKLKTLSPPNPDMIMTHGLEAHSVKYEHFAGHCGLESKEKSILPESGISAKLDGQIDHSFLNSAVDMAIWGVTSSELLMT